VVTRDCCFCHVVCSHGDGRNRGRHRGRIRGRHGGITGGRARAGGRHRGWGYRGWGGGRNKVDGRIAGVLRGGACSRVHQRFDPPRARAILPIGTAAIDTVVPNMAVVPIITVSPAAAAVNPIIG